MSHMSYRRESRKDYGKETSERGGALTPDQLKIGCLLRIADGVETIAKDRDSLERRAKSAEANEEHMRARLHHAEMRIRSYKGRITKLLKLIKKEGAA